MNYVPNAPLCFLFSKIFSMSPANFPSVDSFKAIETSTLRPIKTLTVTGLLYLAASTIGVSPLLFNIVFSSLI